MGVGTEEILSEDLGFASLPAREAVSVPALIRRYHHSLIQFLRQRLRRPEDAYDVAQEAYIRMMQYEGSRDIHSPSSMLYRIAINVANDLERAEQVRRASDQCPIDHDELLSYDPSPELQVAGQQDLALHKAAIEDLPPKCQHV